VEDARHAPMPGFHHDAATVRDGVAGVGACAGRRRGSGACGGGVDLRRREEKGEADHTGGADEEEDGVEHSWVANCEKSRDEEADHARPAPAVTEEKAVAGKRVAMMRVFPSGPLLGISRESGKGGRMVSENKRRRKVDRADEEEREREGRKKRERGKANVGVSGHCCAATRRSSCAFLRVCVPLGSACTHVCRVYMTAHMLARCGPVFPPTVTPPEQRPPAVAS